MIRVRGLRKLRGERAVLDGVDIDVARGEVFALLGPSGCGKTTLLRCLNALEHFDAGGIDIAGEHLGPGRGDRRRDLRLRARVGMVFQGYHLFPHMSAAENVALAPRVVLRRAAGEALDEARRLLERVGLGDRRDARPAAMSGGEQQRVAIARALATRPDVLLLDEPTAALDPERRADLLRLLGSLAEGGQTLVLVTHEIEFARELANRVAVLDAGAVIETGAAREVITAPKSPRVRDFLRALGARG